MPFARSDRTGGSRLPHPADHHHRVVPANARGAGRPGRAVRRGTRSTGDLPGHAARGDRPRPCAGRRRPGSTCSSTGSSSAPTWSSTSASSSAASPSPDHGWVQSYGSRCVKPPIIYGDVWRPAPMTVEWARYAQSLTARPVKGMLTGPVTMLQWSFVRDDQPRAETCRQIALAIRDEVADLEAAGLAVDPDRRARLARRPAVASRASGPPISSGRSGVSGWPPPASPTRRRSTPTCATRSSTTSSRRWRRWMPTWCRSRARARRWNCSRPSGASAIRTASAPACTTSTRRGSRRGKRSSRLLEKALRHIPAAQLWVNPDCGLKTRTWDEVMPALQSHGRGGPTCGTGQGRCLGRCELRSDCREPTLVIRPAPSDDRPLLRADREGSPSSPSTVRSSTTRSPPACLRALHAEVDAIARDAPCGWW